MSRLSEARSIRCVHFSTHRSPAEALAFEARLLEAGRLSLFAYQWQNPVLVLGRGQAGNSVDLDVCRNEGIEVHRRSTGGTGVLHQHTLNIALVLPRTLPWAKEISRLYEYFTSLVQTALVQHQKSEKSLPHAELLHAQTIPQKPQKPPASRSSICFESHTEDTLLFRGKKVFGSAQRRKKDAVLIHGTLALELDNAQQGRVFGVTTAHIERVMTALPFQLDMDRFWRDLTQVTSQKLQGIRPHFSDN